MEVMLDLVNLVGLKDLVYLMIWPNLFDLVDLV